MLLINLTFLGIIFLVLYIIIDLLKNKCKYIFKRLLFYSFIFYLVNILQLTTGGIFIPPRVELGRTSYQIIPFKFVFDLINIYNYNSIGWFFWSSFKLSFYNIIMLLPLGIYLPVLLNLKSLKKIVLYVFMISLFIEVYQLILSSYGFILFRTANVDDLLLNTLGGILGYIIYRLFLIKWIYKYLEK